MTIAQQTVKNTAIIHTSQYKQPDGQYLVFVCIEYQDGVAKMASDISKKVQQQVSDDERMKMNFEFEKFRQRVEDELKKSAAQ